MSSTDQAKLTGDEYVQLLLHRQSEWLAANPPNTRGRLTSLPPLLEWFIRDGDEDLVELPQPAPKPAPRPRTYRSAESLRADRDQLTARRDRIIFGGHDDPAACNINTRARWKQLDRDIAAVAALSRRIQRLDHRIVAAEHREQR